MKKQVYVRPQLTKYLPLKQITRIKDYHGESHISEGINATLNYDDCNEGKAYFDHPPFTWAGYCLYGKGG